MLRFQTEIEFLSGQVDYIKRVFFPLRKDASTLNSLDPQNTRNFVINWREICKSCKIRFSFFLLKHLNVNKR